MKFITIQLTYENKDKEEILVIVSPINCSSNDEPSIKHAIESRRNDPAITIQILVKNSIQAPAEIIIQKIKETFSICSTINVTFVNVTRIDEFMETHLKKGQLFQYCPN